MSEYALTGFINGFPDNPYEYENMGLIGLPIHTRAILTLLCIHLRVDLWNFLTCI